MDAFIEQFFNLGVMAKAFPLLMRGLGMTLLICLAVIPLGFVGGLLVALARLSRSAVLRISVRILTDLFRALPPLVLLILVYSGLPFTGIRLSPFTAVCIAFFLNSSAYYGEVLRAGIESIGSGQWEAARSTGLSGRDTFLFVVLPQAVRNVLPDLVSNTIEVVKLTSIASVVSMTELLYSADMARSITFNASPVVLAGLIYLVLLWPAVCLASRLEHRVGT
ncbi:polar amino acid transport system permease protein [Nitrobacteraceae bacterium AZCC 2161]